MNRATRIVTTLLLIGISMVCLWAFVAIFSMQTSPGGLGSIGLGALLLIAAALTARSRP